MKKLATHNIRRIYLIAGGLILLATFSSFLIFEGTPLRAFFGLNISYHMIYWFLSFLPRLFQDFIPSDKHRFLQGYLKIISYFFFVVPLLAVPIAFYNLIFLADVPGFIGFSPAMAFGLGAINVYKFSKSMEV